MNNFNEPKNEQEEFNKDFLIKFTIFMFYYRFYIMHIDEKGTMVNCIEDFLIKKFEEFEDKKFENVIVDELD